MVKAGNSVRITINFEVTLQLVFLMISVFSTEEEKTYSVHIQNTEVVPDAPFFFFLKASPQPDIMWLKDNVPVTKRVTISNSDGSSQLLIPSSERSDSGIYSIVVKNLVGQETFSTEVRVTGKAKNASECV